MKKIFDSIANWIKEHDISKLLLIIIFILLWCLVVFVFFRGNTESFIYRD